MNTQADCVPCFLRQALEIAELATQDAASQGAFLRKVAPLLLEEPLASPPPRVLARIQGLAGEVMGVADPYAALKGRDNRQAMAVYPQLSAKVREAPDPLQMALRLAAAGNVMDLGVKFTPRPQGMDLNGAIAETVAAKFAICDYQALVESLKRRRGILYLADNAGETVFDRLFLEALGRDDIIYVVKSKPILNDATLEDALFAGIHRLVRVVESGSGIQGTILEDCSPAFRELFREAGVVLAKGQAHYETLHDGGREVFFLLKAKCPLVARSLGVAPGSLVLQRGGSARTFG